MNTLRTSISNKFKEPASKKMFVGFLCGLAIGKWGPELEDRLNAFTSEFLIEQLFAPEHLFDLFMVSVQATGIFLMVVYFLLTLFDQEKWFWLFLLIPAFLGVNFLMLIIFGEFSVGSFDFVFIGISSVGAIVLFIFAFRQWWQTRSIMQ